MVGVCAEAAGEADVGVTEHQLQPLGHLFSSTSQEGVQAETGPLPFSSDHQLAKEDDEGVKVHVDVGERGDENVDEEEEGGEEVGGDQRPVEDLFFPAYRVRAGEDHGERDEVEANSGRTEEGSLLTEACHLSF